MLVYTYKEIIKFYKWRKFIRLNPSLVEYKKPYRTPTDLTQKLINQGLAISNITTAEQAIYSNNYYRLKAYFIPFYDHNKKFIAGTSFDDIQALYEADQKIRDFIFPIIAKIEIRARAILDNVITASTKNPFWHLDPNNFEKYEEVETALKKAGTRFCSGKQEFAIHYRENYFTRKSFAHKQIPPFWIISEIFTLEQLTCFAKNIDKQKFRNTGGSILDKCANEFGFSGYEAFLTNLACLLEMRNICAHHSRLWNRNLRAPNSISKKTSIKTKGKSNRLYQHLIMLRIMCKHQKIDDGIKDFFHSLITSNTTLAAQANSMGFPSGWDTDNIWL